VDLEEQTLIAYEESRPVYSTLASTGRWRRFTPEGTYRIQKKSVATDMSNADRRNTYLVQDVPWVLFYHENHALHGAFWHDELGDRRSRGCVNLAHEDARWVFDWADPPLPTGWHTVYDAPGQRGSTVVVFR
jgi:lipoprotein-anchoring transpeptidase ErfK/SrfK